MSDITVGQPAREEKHSLSAGKTMGIVLWAALLAITTGVFYAIGWTAAGLNLIGVEMAIWAIVYAVMVCASWGYPRNPNVRARLVPTILMYVISIVLVLVLYYLQFPLHGEATAALTFDNKSFMGINVSLAVLLVQFYFLWRGW